MKVSKDASFLFWLYRSKKNTKGQSPLYFRIIVSGQKAEISTSLHVFPTLWDKRQHRVKGETPEVIYINERIEEYIQSFYEACNIIRRKGETFTPILLKRLVLGEEVSDKTFLDLIAYHNKQIEKLIDRDYAYLTYQRYLTTERLVLGFLKSQNRKDILLTELGHKFLSEFETYLKAEKKQQHNSAVKYLKSLKAIINKAIQWQLMEKNPFTGYKSAEKPVFKDFLTKEEVSLIENKTFDIDRIERVKRVFLFQCYTGLAYSDIASLKNTDIREYKGEKWVWKDRNKTGNPIRVPLEQKALDLLSMKENKKPIPVLSNQKMNSYLKEIADSCGITKNLTTHCARRTFATLALSRGVSVESVANMLGHANSTVTQKHYAKVLPEKILAEMKSH